jgi:hypothetical protein
MIVSPEVLAMVTELAKTLQPMPMQEIVGRNGAGRQPRSYIVSAIAYSRLEDMSDVGKEVEFARSAFDAVAPAIIEAFDVPGLQVPYQETAQVLSWLTGRMQAMFCGTHPYNSRLEKANEYYAKKEKYPLYQPERAVTFYFGYVYDPAPKAERVYPISNVVLRNMKKNKVLDSEVFQPQ